MEDLYDPEEKILCPYNSAHHIRRCKMSFHLVKCKKNHGEQKMVPCDFNSTHMIPEPELRYHHQICSDRKKIEAQIIESQMKTESRFPIPNLDCQSEESWDNESAASYDPKGYIESHDVLRHIDVESQTVRKNFRLSERIKFAAMPVLQRESKFPIQNLKYEACENWDNENTPTYDPKKYTETHNVLRQLDVESGAKRKNFRLSERQRLNNLNATNVTAPPAPEPETRRLPPHHHVTNVEDKRDRLDPQMFKQRIKAGSRKMYYQSDSNPGNSENM